MMLAANYGPLMLSMKTCLEFVNVIDSYIEKITVKIFFAFDIKHLTNPINGKLSRDAEHG